MCKNDGQAERWHDNARRDEDSHLHQGIRRLYTVLVMSRNRHRYRTEQVEDNYEHRPPVAEKNQHNQNY